ncbi:MAG TPA: sialidase family protein [Pyrinomonadaceae bacterium]|jgi:hypothetical protein
MGTSRDAWCTRLVGNGTTRYLEEIRVALVLAGVLMQILFGSPDLAAQSKDLTTGLITVGQNIQVSKSRRDQFHWEVLMAADPESPKNLLACSVVGNELSLPHKHSVVAYSSFDGGRSWQETLNIIAPGGVVDPTCSFGRNGKAYMTALTYGIGGIPVFKSTNSGRTWSESLKLPRRGVDRPYFTVDNTGGKYGGRIFLNAMGLVPSLDNIQASIYGIDLWRSSDDGETLFGPVRRAVTRPNHVLNPMGNGVVLSDGTFLAVTGEYNEASFNDQQKPNKAIGRLLVVSSKDGGETLLPAVTVSDWFPDSRLSTTGNLVPVMATDSSTGPFKDRLYVVWSDLRLGRAAVWISHSSNGGENWSTPLVVSDVPKTDEAFMPTIAVNSSGVVGVMWYDRRDSPDELGYWPRFSVSIDGGESFMPSVKISESPSSFQTSKLILVPWTFGAGSGRVTFNLGVDGRQFSGGDTSGLAASPDGVFHPLWVDNRTGIAQVWTAPVTVIASATQNGVAEPSGGMSDITDRVVLRFNEAIYDRSKHTITVDAYLENTSREAISGQIKLQLISLRSELGQVSVANSDNRIERAGAIWDFSQQVENGVLKAGARSRPKELAFLVSEESLANVHDQMTRKDALRRMIVVSAKVWVPTTAQHAASKREK